MNITLNESMFNANKFMNCPSIKTMDISIIRQYCQNYTVTFPLISFGIIFALGIVYMYADLRDIKHGFVIRASCIALMTSIALVNLIFPLVVWLWG